MSSEDIVVSLKLQSGQVFDGFHVDNLECTLAEFIDHSLKVLEVCQSCKIIWYSIVGGRKLKPYGLTLVMTQTLGSVCESLKKLKIYCLVVFCVRS